MLPGTKLSAIDKITAGCFNKCKVLFKKTGILFCINRSAEDEIASAKPCTQSEKDTLEEQHCKYSSRHSSINHVSMCSQPDTCYSIVRLGHFLTVLCSLRHGLLRKPMCYLHSYPKKPLIFLKKLKQSNRVLQVYWLSNKSEEFTLKNTLEAF